MKKLFSVILILSTTFSVYSYDQGLINEACDENLDRLIKLGKDLKENEYLLKYYYRLDSKSYQTKTHEENNKKLIKRILTAKITAKSTCKMVP